jgi:hypothetical protein
MGTSPKTPKKKPEPKKPVAAAVAQPDPKEAPAPQAAAKHPPAKTMLPAGIPPNISNMFGSKGGKGPRFTATKGRNFRHQGR